MTIPATAEPAVIGIDDSERDVAEKQGVQTIVYIIYGTAMLLWILLWTFTVGWRTTSQHPAFAAGFAATLLLLAMNMAFTSSETVGTYLAERSEASALQGAAFPLIVALFSMGSMIMSLQRELVQRVLPLFMLAFFFAIMLVIPPVWVQTTTGKPTIIVKHIKSAFFAYGLGFAVAAMSHVYFSKDRASLLALPASTAKATV